MTLTHEERQKVREGKAITARVNKERRTRAKAARTPEKRHRGRERDAAHLQFIRRLPCACGCGAQAPSDAAHVRLAAPDRGKPFTGMQVKPSDRWTLPLARPCHERQHGGSEAAFWSALGIDPIDLCIRLYAASGDEDSALKVLSEVRQGRGDHG